MLLTLFIVFVSYLLGCFSTAYYVVRWRTDQDIRTLGSGAAGARNAGRVLGRNGFIVVFAGDLLKGALAVWLAQTMALPAWGVAAALVAVVLGHLYPVQLNFRGGKGAATGFGAGLVLNPALALLCLGVAGAVFALTRNFTVSGIVAFVAAPVLAYLLGISGVLWGAITAVALLLLYAHRTNLRLLHRQFSSSSTSGRRAVSNDQ